MISNESMVGQRGELSAEDIVSLMADVRQLNEKMRDKESLTSGDYKNVYSPGLMKIINKLTEVAGAGEGYSQEGSIDVVLPVLYQQLNTLISSPQPRDDFKIGGDIMDYPLFQLRVAHIISLLPVPEKIALLQSFSEEIIKPYEKWLDQHGREKGDPLAVPLDMIAHAFLRSTIQHPYLQDISLQPRRGDYHVGQQENMLRKLPVARTINSKFRSELQKLHSPLLPYFPSGLSPSSGRPSALQPA